MKSLIRIISAKAKRESNQEKQQGGIDLVFLLLVFTVTLFGTVMVFSAGGAYAKTRYGDEYYFIKKQAVWLLIGIAVMYLSSRVRPEIYRKYTPHLYCATLVLLVLVLLVGFVGNGAQRWISIGPLTIQPSEIAKLSLVMMLSKYFNDKQELSSDIHSEKNIFVYGTLIPCLIMLVPIILVMLQKHLSCIIILGTIGLLLIFAAGVNPKYIYGFCIAAAAGITSLALFTDYTKERITVWQNPEAYKLTGGWQTLQGLMAIGSGGLFGVGLGNSIMKHCYVSEPANDMIFAILCEELGLFGAALALFVFGALVLRGTKIALNSSDTYSRLVALGICIKMATQVLLNVAVVTNTIPNTGISLPFFSYGGSSLIMLFFEMGIILSISRSSRLTK
ncbi:MAG: FtsW/RodA/SpoVE family cell cycle protein [Clostridia bacterium]|nr:FtsW/RodA/SpoVE family cell cycle protein [Clostridia bacterium]MBP3583651.1 FtsW/RodA/SpoVE family cell cycle protein [Clostridia bacterium]